MRRVPHLQRVRFRLRGHHVRTHMLRKRRRVQGGGHGGEKEVVAKNRHLHTHRQRQIRIQLTLVHLIQNHRVHAVQLRVLQQAVQQHAGGDKLHQLAALGFAADGVAGKRRGVEKRKAPKRRTNRNPARGRDQRLPMRIRNRRRDQRRLTRTRRRLNHQRARLRQLAQHPRHRQTAPDFLQVKHCFPGYL